MANSEEVRHRKINDFITKVGSYGYTVKHEPDYPTSDRIIVSEDDYHHIVFPTDLIMENQFERILQHIQSEIEKLEKETLT